MRDILPTTTAGWTDYYHKCPANVYTRFSHKCRMRYGIGVTQALMSFIYAVLQDDITLERSPTGKKYELRRQGWAVAEDDAWDAYRVRILRQDEVINPTTFLDSDFK